MRWITGIFALSLVGCGSSSNDVDDPSGGKTSSGGQLSSGGTSASGGGGGTTSASGGSGQAGSSSGGATSGGTSGGGGNGSGGGGANGSGGGGATGPLETCEATPNPGLPEGAPALTPGTWVEISPPQVDWDHSNTQGMAVDSCNPAVLYLCACANMDTENRGVYKTTDAGSTWNKVGHLDTPLHVRVDPKDPNHLYANDGVWGGTQGFFVSTDGGETFVTPPSFAALGPENDGMFVWDTYDVVADPSNFDHVLVSFHSAWGWTDSKWKANAGILESTDGGDSWIIHEPMDTWGYGHAINFLYRPDLGIGDANTWLLGTQGGGFFRTTDAGESWTKVSEYGIQHGGGTVYYTNDGTLYASGADQNLRSTDNGETWTKVGPGGGYNAVGGDGENLYAAKCFGPTPFVTSPESDGVTWGNYSEQSFDSGAYEFGFDPANGILYSASWGAGLWALKP